MSWEPEAVRLLDTAPHDAIELVLHEHFWDFFQSAEHQDSVVKTLISPVSLRALISAVIEAGPGLGLCSDHSHIGVFTDGPVRYFNPNPGHGSSGVLVTQGQGSAAHRLPFCACQVLLVPQIVQAVLASDEMLSYLFGFVASPGPLPTVRAGYFVNIVYMLLDSDASRLLSFISGPTLRQIIGHVLNDSIRKLVCQRIDGLVAIGADPSTSTVSWVGLLGHEQSLGPLQQMGASSVAMLVERLEALWVALGPGDSCGDQICSLYGCIADLSECWAAAGASAVSSKALLELHSEDMAAVFLRPLEAAAALSLQPEVAREVELAALCSLTAVVQAGRSWSTSSQWHATPLRSRLRQVLPTIASWLGLLAGARPSWMDADGSPAAVGSRRYAASRLVAELCQSDSRVDWLALADSGVLQALGASIFQHPTSSLLHSEVVRAVKHLLTHDGVGGGIGDAMAARHAMLLGSGALLNREYAKYPGQRYV